MKVFWNRIFMSACGYFTLLTLIYAVGVYAIYTQSGALSPLRVLLFFIFALIIATANSLFRMSWLNVALRIVAHAIVVGLGFWLCLVRPMELEGSGELMGLLLFLVVYAVIAVIVLLHRSNVAKKLNRESEYKSVYKK